MKTNRNGTWIAALTVSLVVIGWAAPVTATHPIQRNWEFQFALGTERPFFISGGFSGVGQRANLEGSIFIDDDDHGMPILRELDPRR